MALTPEDVVNKRFQHVKFRDGYDQDEVDDFLDEVVVELRRLNQENDDLRQKLSVAEQRVSELESGADKNVAADADATQAMPAAVAPGTDDKAEKKADDTKATSGPVVASQQPAGSAPVAKPATEAPVAEATPAKDDLKPEPKADDKALDTKAAQAAPAAAATAAAPVKDAPSTSAPAPATPAAPSAGTDAHGLIALAQRVHDEHIAEGEKTRDQMIGDAKKKAADIVAEAQKKRDETLQQLEAQKSNLEKEIDGLQSFERTYRTRLKSYLTDQLRDLENSGSLAPETLSKDAKHSL